MKKINKFDYIESKKQKSLIKLKYKLPNLRRYL